MLGFKGLSADRRKRWLLRDAGRNYADSGLRSNKMRKSRAARNRNLTRPAGTFDQCPNKKIKIFQDELASRSLQLPLVQSKTFFSLPEKSRSSLEAHCTVTSLAVFLFFFRGGVFLATIVGDATCV